MTQLTADIVERRKATEDRRLMERRGRKSVVQSARERLTSTTGLDRTFDYESLRLFARAKTSSCIILSVYTLMVAAALTVWSAAAFAILWGSVSISALVLGALVAQRFNIDATEETAPHWRRRFVALETFQSIVWSSICVISLTSPSDLLLYFLIVALLIYSGASSSLASPIRTAIFASVGPVLIAIVAIAGISTDVGALMLATLAIFAVIVHLVLARRTHETTLATLGLGAEKDTLFSALQEANAKHDEARRRAEEANLAKSRFLATMSHELRTPLNAILGFSEVMKSELFGPHAVEQYKEYSNDIHSSGQHLLNIINEILDLSRIEAGRYELQEEPVDLAATVDDCRHMLELRARAKSITMRAMLEAGLPRLWADERAIRQIAINLLANAIKFTPQGGEITVKVGWTASGGQYVAIRDTGPGIPEDELPTVLESFGRGSMAIKTAEQGTGLGLPIVQGLIDLHGGQFDLRSKLREGTEVVAIFPAGRVMETVAPVEQAA